MALVAHYNLELHQMDVEMVFLNGNLGEDITWSNRKVLKKREQKLICKLKKSLYAQKQAPGQ